MCYVRKSSVASFRVVYFSSLVTAGEISVLTLREIIVMEDKNAITV